MLFVKLLRKRKESTFLSNMQSNRKTSKFGFLNFNLSCGLPDTSDANFI